MLNTAVSGFWVSGDWLSKVGWSSFVGFGLRKRLFYTELRFCVISVKNMKGSLNRFAVERRWFSVSWFAERVVVVAGCEVLWFG